MVKQMHLLNIILFIGLIISLSICIVGCNESHARIQSYENITTAGCGCGRNARLGYNKCFKYITEVHPWAVFITNFINGTWNGMSGVILNERWILTCAHGLYCGVNCTSNDIRVYLGLRNQRYTNHTYYTSGQYFIHPTYESYQWKPFDLGLIRVDTDIPLDGTFGLTGSNAICLPNKMAINKNTEYAQLVGHGIENNTGFGLITIQKAYDNDAPGLNYVIKGRRIPYNLGSDICTVDSGSPIVQYVNGVAVVIGVVVNALRDPRNYCMNLRETTAILAVRVSHHIQWIINTIYNNNN